MTSRILITDTEEESPYQPLIPEPATQELFSMGGDIEDYDI